MPATQKIDIHVISYKNNHIAMLPANTIRLHPCRKQYTLDQDKACSPEETVKHFLKRLERLDLDILREVRRIDNGRLGIPVYFSVCGRDALAVTGTKKQMGKGSTPAQARASACMELAERFSFFSFVGNDTNFVTGDYHTLASRGYPLLPLETLLFSVSDITHSTRLLGQMLAGLPLRWTWATPLTGERDVLVPFSWFYAINEFNGPAAGNTMEEAVLQGLSEIIERHVCARVSQEKISTPAIDLNSVTDPVARQLITAFKQCGIMLFCNDFTLDTGIPTVAAVAWDPTTFPEQSEIVYTAGTTPDPTKALIRALTEVAQLAGDFNTGANYVASGLPKPRTPEEIDFLIHSGQRIRIDDMAQLGHDDIREEILNCCNAIEQLDLIPMAINTTHPDLGIPACYVIVPGCHFRERTSGDALLFAAKLAAELLPPRELARWLTTMQERLADRYYLEFYRGRNLLDQMHPEAALACFDKALALQPLAEDIPYIHAFKGCALRDLERYDEAIETLHTGLEWDERRPDIHNILGVCYFRLGDHRQAAAHFQRAVELNPASAIDYANLALNLEQLGQTEEARINYEIALSQDPSIAFAREGLARLQQ